MASSFYKDFTNNRKMGPVYTLKEFASLKGINYSTVLGRMNKSKSKPPIIQQRLAKRYYSLDSLELWHKDYE